jgi:aspartyl-tRNA(Asn)/glutamyl-tRNA(Gln) amidotransferase subunit B
MTDQTTSYEPRATTYTPIIGLEVHVELKTKSKMFCSCSADYFGQEPNTHTCPVCLGLPGALPVPNRQAIEWCMMIAKALNCTLASFSKFDRKNYFYPDLPKGYQISQYDLPFGEHGYMILKSGKKVGVTRVHMEEDTAKLTHQFISQRAKGEEQRDENVSLVDFNRSGLPLVEIVTEPDFNTAEEVTEYLTRLRQIVRYLGVSNADMEKGDMRLEPNISLTTSNKVPSPLRRGQGEVNKNLLPDYKVEVKNINSFRFVAQAIAYENKRQAELLDAGQRPPQETRGWNEAKQKTVSQRLKEEANDYRYFPEPDIPPFRFTEAELADIAQRMPELPDEKFNRFKSEYGLPDYDLEILTRERETADYFEAVVAAGKAEHVDPKKIANVIINKKVDPASQTPEQVIAHIKETTQTLEINASELIGIVESVIAEHAQAVQDYKNGKEASLMFLLGQTMRKIGRKVDANLVRETIVKTIAEK